MKRAHGPAARTPRSRSGAALLLSLLILLVLVAIVLQINVTTGTDARVARNDVGLTTMDLAVESALLQVSDQLSVDGESAAGASTPESGAATAAAAAGGGMPAGGGQPGGGSQQQQPVDSRRDDWAQPARTDINEINLRILVQDEDSKINVLTMLSADEKEAEAALERVVRCLDLCREGTEADIDQHTADRMARAMLEHMKSRKLSKLPRPSLLTDDPAKEDVGLPLSLKEFAVLAPFEESHFRDFRDADGKVVHSIGSFLTVWSSVATVADLPRVRQQTASPGWAGAATTTSTPGSSSGGSSSGSGSSASGSTASGGGPSSGQPSTSSGTSGSGSTGTTLSGNRVETGGWAVNVNTAPVAVLKALFDDRDLHPRFWDRVIEYRNLEEEEPEGAPAEEEAPAALDEYGNEIIERRIFESLGELSEVVGYQDLGAQVQARLTQMLTTQSRVFSIFVIARRSTSAEASDALAFGTPEEIRLREEQGDSLVRVVRSVVWRRIVDDKVEIVPLVRWEVLDYAPYDVQDYPDEER